MCGGGGHIDRDGDDDDDDARRASSSSHRGDGLDIILVFTSNDFVVALRWVPHDFEQPEAAVTTTGTSDDDDGVGENNRRNSNGDGYRYGDGDGDRIAGAGGAFMECGRAPLLRRRRRHPTHNLSPLRPPVDAVEVVGQRPDGRTTEVLVAYSLAPKHLGRAGYRATGLSRLFGLYSRHAAPRISFFIARLEGLPGIGNPRF